MFFYNKRGFLYGIDIVRFFKKTEGSTMFHFPRLKKVSEWVKEYDALLFIAFLGFGWLLSWLTFVVFALLFVN